MRYCILGILSLFFTIGQANAEVISCNNGKYADGTDCVSCGADCNWSVDLTSGKLTVSGSGNMNNYSFYTEDDITYSSAPGGGYRYRITAVEVSGMSSIGRCAFCHLAVNSIQMDDSVKKINESAFAWNGGGASSVTMSDALTNLGFVAFRGNSRLNTLIVPATLTNIGLGALGGNKNLIKDMNIVCMGGKQECALLHERLQNYQFYGTDYSREVLDLSANVRLAGAEECFSTNYYWNGAECLKEPVLANRLCCPECKMIDGECYRVRYTLPEADEITSDDNENMIEWIFN